MNQKVLELAVDLTKVAMSTLNKDWINVPDKVAEFLAAQVRKLDQLSKEGKPKTTSR